MIDSDAVKKITRDQELAAQYRAEMTLALQNVIEVIGRARKQDLVISFSLGLDQSGRDFINILTVARYL